MASFNELEYDKRTELLHIGAGCILHEVDMALQAPDINRFIVDSSPDLRVGVSNFLLGGGYSLYTNEHGLGIDNIVEVEMVLPTGEICVASSKEQPELFFAVKVRMNSEVIVLLIQKQGGGNNFGVVTSFTVKTHPRKKAYVRICLYHANILHSNL